MNNLKTTLKLIPREDFWKLALLCCLILGNAFLETIGIALILPLVELVTNPERILSHPQIKLMYEFLGSKSPAEFTIISALVFLFVIIGKNLYFYYMIKLQSRFINTCSAKVGLNLFNYYIHQPYEFHISRNTAELINRIQFTVHGVFGGSVLGYISLATEVVMLSVILILLLTIEPIFTLTTGLILISCLGPVYFLTRRHLQVLGADSINLQEHRQKCLQQSLSSIKDVKILGRELFFQKQIRVILHNYSKTQVKSAVIMQIPRLVVEVFVVLIIVFALIYSVYKGNDGAELTSLLSLFAAAAFRMIPSLNRLLMAMNNIRFADEAVRQLSADLLQRNKTRSPPDQAESPVTFNESISVDNVVFRYKTDGQTILKNLTLQVRKGESIGLIGPSGSGKSTLVDLILGLLSPQSGTVHIDGRDITNNPRHWQKLVGYVPQQVSLTDDTLRNNVAFGIEEDDIDDKRVRSSLSLAQLSDFVTSQPSGLDAPLGERGVRLSGGQRQRIGIARALYEDPQVLVLDEATSALDNQTEREITAAIDALRGEKTLIIIAHRLSTIRRCDRIVLLHDGQIEAMGTFEELERTCEHFRHMLQLAELVRENPEDSHILA